MPLSATIATIIDRTKRLEICDTLHDAQNATTEDELIKAGLPLVVYTYQSEIVDDALLASDFTEATLNQNNIYTTGTFSLNNPHDEIFIMRNADVTVTLADSLVEDSRCKITVMGSARLTLIARDTSYATVKAFNNSVLNITINDDAMVDLETRDNCNTSATLNNNSIFHLNGRGHSITIEVGNDNSYTLAKTEQYAELTYTLNGAAQILVNPYQQSQIFLT